MFECFTEKALNTVIAAQEYARSLGRNRVGTELLLLGILSDNSDIAGKILRDRGLTLDKVKLEIENITVQGADNSGVEILFTDNARKVLQAAWDISARLGHNYIGRIHLLYGLVNINTGIALKVFNNLGIDVKELKNLINETLSKIQPMPLSIKTPTSYLIFRKSYFIMGLFVIVLVFLLLGFYLFHF